MRVGVGGGGASLQLEKDVIGRIDTNDPPASMSVQSLNLYMQEGQIQGSHSWRLVPLNPFGETLKLEKRGGGETLLICTQSWHGPFSRFCVYVPFMYLSSYIIVGQICIIPT